jgi:sterol-4alpha-carboxylate 3-dehydrogenase (decarboxylating)
VRVSVLIIDVYCIAILILLVTDDLSSSFSNIDETWPVSPISSIYGESKVQAERLVLDAQAPDFATCVLRPSVIFGEDDTQLIPSIHACIASGETPYVIGDGMNLWDTDYVGNVADAHVLAVQNLFGSKTASGEVFFVQNDERVPFRDLCLAIWKNFHHFPPYEITIPKALGSVMGSLSEWYGWFANKPVSLSRGSVMDACAVRYASGRKAEQVLGHRPKIGLEEGLRRSCEVCTT